MIETQEETVRGDPCMEVLELAGRLIMENGGEIFRAEETITRMGKGFCLDQTECFAVPSGLFISCRKGSGDVETSVLRIRNRNTDLGKVDAVNQISRDIERGLMTRAEARTALLRLQKDAPSVSLPLVALGVGISSAGFALMFNGTWIDFLIALVYGTFCWLIGGLMPKIGVSRNAPTLLLSLLLTFGANVFCRLTGLGNPDAIIPGCLMPLVPGLAMTSAVQDTVRGDTISGITHGLNAVLTAVLIAVGTVIATRLSAIVLYQCPTLTIAAGSDGNFWKTFLLAFPAAFLGSFGFAMLLKAPRRSWAPAGMLGGFSYLLYTALVLFCTPAVAALAVCTLTSYLAQLMARHFKMIGTIYLTMDIVPFVPGYALYRSMALVGDQQYSAGLSAAAQTMVMILMIVLGLSLGDYLFHAFHRKRGKGRQNR